jgi:hypothetical protein
MNRSLLLRVLTGAALLVVAGVHVAIAPDYSGIGKHPFALGDQFYVQSVIAVVLTIALFVRPHLLVWLATAGFAAGSLAVLVYSRYKTIPIPGFPPGFMETWDARGARLSAWAEGAALVLATVGAALALKARQVRSS